MSRQIGIGLVGVGWGGSVLLRALCQQKDVELVGIYTPNQVSAAAVISEFNLSLNLLFNAYEQLLDHPRLSAVVLASPNSSHGPQALAAMTAGKHVFCEKPAATTFEQFQQQVQMQQRAPELCTMVRYSLFFDPMSQWLKRAIDAGHFGEIAQVQVNYRHPVNISQRRIWKLDRKIVGDAIGMAIIHAIYQCVQMLASQASPVGVYATCKAASVRPFEVPPIWNILIRFDNGATATVLGNIDFGNGYDLRHDLSGSAGAFVFDSLLEPQEKVRYWSANTTNGQWIRPLDPKRCPEELLWPADMTLPDSGDVIHHQTDQTLEYFIEHIRSNREPELSFAKSAVVAQIGWAAQMSADTKQEIPIPLNYASAQTHFAPRGVEHALEAL